MFTSTAFKGMMRKESESKPNVSVTFDSINYGSYSFLFKKMLRFILSEKFLVNYEVVGFS